MPDLPDRCDGCGEPFELGDEIEQVANMRPAPGEAAIIFVHHDSVSACLARFAPGARIELVTDHDVRDRLAGEAQAFLEASPGRG